MPGTSRQSPLFGDTPYDRAHRDDDLYDSAAGKIIILCFVSGSRTLAKPNTLSRRTVHGKILELISRRETLASGGGATSDVGKKRI